jgi:ribosomal protein S18 acetylase RimI-like enzyme
VDIVVRRAGADDAGFLAQMLAHAMAWRPGSTPPPETTVRASRYVVGWPRAGDGGLVAEAGVSGEGDRDVGAAWYRVMTADDPGYGFVDGDTPEITIGVVPSWRRRGVGRRLLVALLEVARADGHHALSLSVEHDNGARRLYESIGFESHEKVGDAWTMVVDLR